MPKITYNPDNDINEAISLCRTIAGSLQFSYAGDGLKTSTKEEQWDFILSMAILEKHLETIAQKMGSSR